MPNYKLSRVNKGDSYAKCKLWLSLSYSFSIQTMTYMDSDIKDKVEYIIALISEFAKAHSLTTNQAYRYLERYKAIDFIDKHYGIAHTQSFKDVVSDITIYCRRFGGAI